MDEASNGMWNGVRDDGMNRRKRAGQLWDLHEGQLREVDYWIAVSEKVGTERLIHEGTPDGQKTVLYVRVAIFNPSAT